MCRYPCKRIGRKDWDFKKFNGSKQTTNLNEYITVYKAISVLQIQFSDSKWELYLEHNNYTTELRIPWCSVSQPSQLEDLWISCPEFPSMHIQTMQVADGNISICTIWIFFLVKQNQGKCILPHGKGYVAWLIISRILQKKNMDTYTDL